MIKNLVEKYQLQPHPEGGYYREVYRSEGLIPESALPYNFNGDRNYATSIYFLLSSDNFSAFHRIKQDEIWHFYSGSNLFIHSIDPQGIYLRTEVGLQGKAVPQFVVPKGHWFASSVKDKDSYSFVGCTVAPGFDFRDFELAERGILLEDYPEHEKVIRRYTR